MKGLLLLAGALAMSANAQKVTFYPGNAFSRASADTQWLVEEIDESLTIYDAATATSYVNPGSYVGRGNCVTNSGIVVGGMPGDLPGYWSAATQDWQALPTGDTQLFSGSNANGITADGKYICGSIACGDYMSEGRISLIPVIWTRQADGTYGVYEELPFPTKDFLGSTPQYVTALSISDDGCTVAGQIVDNTGFYDLMILYHKDGEGKWSYSIPDPSLVYDAEKLGDIKNPGDAPSYPDAKSYMDDEALEKYNQAMENFEKELQDFYNGLIDELPNRPDEKDFLSEEGKAAYQEAYEKYQKADEEYWEAFAQFDEAVREACTGRSYNFNSVNISGNGKYVITELSEEPLDFWSMPTFTPVRIDVADGTSTVNILKGTDMISSAVTDDGMVVVGAPSLEYTRNSFVFTDATAEPVSIMDYVKGKDAEIAKWMDENLRHDITVEELDPETYDVISYVVSDSLTTGSVRCDASGTHFYSFLYDVWTGSYEALSYVFTLDATDGIRAVATEQRPKVAFKDGRIRVAGNVKSVNIYDAAGRQLPADTRIVSGTYVVRTEDNAGHVASQRVVVK